MSGLAHYLEDEGIPTVLIALVREHAAEMRPPRALWVPFMLGRPFGEPDQPELQTDVIRQALALLSAESGPVLVDADVPESEADEGGDFACPVSFSKPGDSATDVGTRVVREVAELRSWYELGIERRGRTTVGLSRDPVEVAARELASFVEEPDRRQILSDPSSTESSLRWWLSDLKAYYWEAVTARPGDASAQQLENWFWNETAAGELLLRLRQLCLDHDAAPIREVGLYMVGAIEGQYYADLARQQAGEPGSQ